MGDLNVGKIPLGKIALEKVNLHSDCHIKAIDTMRDKTAIDMCYDIYEDIAAEKRGQSFGNPFFVKQDSKYVGYMYVSDQYDGERILAYIVEESVRGKGLGKVMLTSVSDYLFKCCDTTSLKLYINNKNQASINLAVGCGFNKTTVTDGVLCGYDKKR